MSRLITINFASLLVVIVAMIIGCAGPRRDEPLARPLMLNDPQEQLGQRVFMHSCYECHPGGRAAVGPAIHDKPLPQAAIRTQVRVGAGAMPGFSKDRLSDEEVNAVAKYLVALRKNGRT